MLNPDVYEFCKEVYIVEKSLEVVVNFGREERRIRIDALYAPASPTKYSTASYIQENITVQPIFPSTGKGFSRKPEATEIWIPYDLGYTNRDSADDALQQALSFLADRCRRAGE